MGIVAWIKSFFKAPEQKALWRSAFGSHRSTYDVWRTLPEPNTQELVDAYEDIVYACVSLIASKLATVPIRLYVKTARGERKPKCLTKGVDPQCWATLLKKGYGQDVQEVIEHPLLSLLNKCNPYHNKLDLIELTQIYQELTGNAFWLLEFNGLRIPQRLYLLPSQYVSPDRNEAGMVTGWMFGQGSDERRYTPEEILHFKFANPADPYALGTSPLRAAWGRRQIGVKELSYLDNVLSNMGRPDGILALKEATSPFEAERLAKEWTQRFTRQGEGGVLITDGTMSYQQLNYAPRDLAELQLYQVIKTTVANCFHIPPDIFELGVNSNRSTRDAAIYSLAEDCIKPRLEKLVHRLNLELVPFFDERLFFCADPCVPEDKEATRADTDMLLRHGILLRDEARLHYGLPSAEWAQEPLLPSGVVPAPTTEELFMPEATTFAELPPSQEEINSRSAAIAALQTAVYSGAIPREAALANAVLVFRFTREEAEALFPEVVREAPPVAPEDAQTEQVESEQHQQEEQSQEQEKDHDEPLTFHPLAQKAVMRQRSPEPLVRALQRVFQRQASEVLGKVKAFDEIQTKTLPADWLPLERWTEEAYRELSPIVALYYQAGAKSAVAELGGSPTLMHAVQPKLKEGVDRATLLFCRATNESTRLALDEALSKLRQELTEGLVEGDVKMAMAQRVQKVFTDASNDRAFVIGVTEASRGQHAAQEITARESGVVTGKKWLLSDDACPICKPLNGKVVPLGENFTVDGEGPYSEVAYPPRHPQCRCTVLLET